MSSENDIITSKTSEGVIDYGICCDECGYEIEDNVTGYWRDNVTGVWIDVRYCEICVWDFVKEPKRVTVEQIWRRQEEAHKEQERLRVPESERRRLREECEERERQSQIEREEEIEEYRAWREQQKPERNPALWNILAKQESARLQERERLRDEEREQECMDEDNWYQDEEEDEEEDMPLRNMNDVQIERYVELIGLCPRDECDEWTMVYNGGDILRYSYCKFIQWGIEDQTVSNITITRATFDEVTFTNYVFDNVTFDECVFKDIVLNNTTFKNSKFIDCQFDSSIVPDKSCEIINYDFDDDNVTFVF